MSGDYGAAGTGGGTYAASPAHGLIDGNRWLTIFPDNGFECAEAFADQAPGAGLGINFTGHGFQGQSFPGFQFSHDPAGCGMPLGHRRGDIFRLLCTSCRKDPFPNRGNRIQSCVGLLKKPIFPQFHIKNPGYFPYSLVTLHGRSQNDHIKFVLFQFPLGIRMGNQNASGSLSDLNGIRPQQPKKPNTIFRQNHSVKALGLFSRETQIGMKLTNSGFRQLQPGLVCMFQGIKATNTGTVFIEFFRS